MDNEKLLKDKTILITGANGILELRVIRKLLNLNTAIRIIGIDHRTDNVSDPEKAYCRKQILRAVSEHPERQCTLWTGERNERSLPVTTTSPIEAFVCKNKVSIVSRSNAGKSSFRFS